MCVWVSAQFTFPNNFRPSWQRRYLAITSFSSKIETVPLTWSLSIAFPTPYGVWQGSFSFWFWHCSDENWRGLRRYRQVWGPGLHQDLDASCGQAIQIGISLLNTLLDHINVIVFLEERPGGNALCNVLGPAKTSTHDRSQRSWASEHGAQIFNKTVREELRFGLKKSS